MIFRLARKGTDNMILIDGKNLCLRRAETDDLEYIMKLQSDAENSSYIVPFPREKHEKVIQSPIESMDVIAEEKKSGERAGYFFINGLTNEFNELEFTHFIIDKKGQGYGHEAMKLLKAWAFEQKKAHRAWMDCKDYNARALHLYESEGMKREGLIRETIMYQGKYENLVVLGILDREYFDRRQQGLEDI